MVGGDEGQPGVVRRPDVPLGEVFDRVSDAVVALDEAALVTYANDRAVALAGVDADEIVGLHVGGALPSLADALMEAFERAMARQEPVECESFHEPTGDWMRIELHPSPTGVTVCVRDVTDRKARERTESLEAQRFRTVVESMDDAVMIKDREGRYQLINGAGAAALGRSRSDVLGRTDPELFGEAVGGRMREREREVLETEEARTYRETLPTADGERVYETTRVPYYGPGGALTGTVGICRDVTDRLARKDELRRYETLVETSPDAMFTLDENLVVTYVNDVVEELTGYEPETMVGEHITTLNEWGLYDEDDFEEAVEHVRRVLDPDGPDYAKYEVRQFAPDDEPWDAEYHVAAVDGDGACVVGVVRDITDRVEQEEQIRSQRDELDSLNRINALIQEIIQGLLEATSREEIESLVVEQLTDSEFYECAWIGERERDGIAVRAGAGDEDYFGAVESVDLSGGGLDLTLSTGESVLVDDVTTDDRVPESVREEARARGYRSNIIVSLRHGSATYGALVVNAPRRKAFSERERAAFELLGETVGFAVNAVQNRRLLLGDDIVEYTFRISDTTAFLFQVSDRFDATCTLEWTVPGEDDSVLLYASITGAEPDEVLALADEHDNVRDVRVLGDGDDGTLFEVAVVENTATALFDCGARPTAFVAESGSARFTVEAPPSVDIDAVVDALDATESDTELVAKREVGRSGRTASDFREVVGAELTERQRSVLRAADRAGYFDWPRDSTAEELAEMLGVSSPTVHYHLRRAQNALVDAFLHG